MVIFVEGTPLTKVTNSTDEFYRRFPSIVEKGSSFASQNSVRVQKEYVLYVAQREFGVVPSNDPKIKYVGSDDATTCHIVIIKHSSGTVGVSHLDGSQQEEETINCMISKISHIENAVDALELYVVGGYVPEEGSKEARKNESEHLSIKILDIFTRHKCRFDLFLWCTCRLNTVQGHNGPQPAVYGTGVDLVSGAVFPATFKSHDPDIPLRSASRWMKDSTTPCDLYDHISRTISIDPFYYSGVECFSFYIELPDDVILDHFSTSPKVEPPCFVRDLREVFKVFVVHPDPHVTLFPNNKPKRYSMNNSGLWELMQEQN